MEFLRLAVPNFEVCAELYLKGLPFAKLFGPLYGKMQMNGKLIYHKTVFDFKSLKKILETLA